MASINDTEQVKACCATAYGSDVVRLLLGDAYHPGGLTLTRHLADLMELRPTDRVLDLAAGRGTTALLLATEYGVHVNGLDLSAANVALARGAAHAAGLGDRVTFVEGDAERLPYPDTSLDAIVCECALCLFPDKHTAARQMSRVLRPGARLGLTDITADPDRLPPELLTLTARIACTADAHPLDRYADLLSAAGLTITHTEHHDNALARMIDQIEARLHLIRMTAPERSAGLGLDPPAIKPVLAAARAAIVNGSLGYGLIIAQCSEA
jgi:ubiquinone/menaquinone biosynthesis C-methylase UbiE